jgi:hypothetical protein
MKRWLALAVGLALIGAGAWFLLRGPARVAPESSAPHAEIDDASRAALDRVLREAEREEAKRP